MIPNLLLSRFTLFTSTPKSIVRLRNLILQLAFLGKFVSQNINDVSTFEVLRSTKEELASQRKQEKKEIQQLDQATLPRLPKSWKWTSLGEISEINPRFTDKDLDNDLDVTFLPMRCVEEITGIIDTSITKKLSATRKVIHILKTEMCSLRRLPLVWRMAKLLSLVTCEMG